jgi:hypothetical protein
MFVQMHRSERTMTQRAEDAYQVERKAWDAQIGRAWDAEVERVQRRVQMDRQMDKASRTPGAVSNPASIVRAHLSKHPEDATLSARELAGILGVSKSTAANVKAAFPSNDGQAQDNHNGAH